MTIYPDEPPTPTSDAIRAWYATLLGAMSRGVRPDQGVFVAPLPPLVASARATDFRTAHWAMDSATDAGEAEEQDHWCARAFFSQRQTHCALLFAGDLAEWDGGAVLWIDGAPMAVPRASDGSSRIDDAGEWLDPHRFAVPLGGLHAHPRASVKLTSHGLGDVRGLWVYDTATHTARTVLPPDDQAWHHPVAAMVGGQLTVYATPQDRQDGRVAWRENASSFTG